MNTQTKLFELIEALCLAEGGDGDAGIICLNWSRAADDFEKWLKETNNTIGWVRENRDNHVVFGEGQQAIWFSDKTENTVPYLINWFETKYDCPC